MFSFHRGQAAVDLSPFTRRICDLTTPNHPMFGDNPRGENRYNRTIPELICPWHKKTPMPEAAELGLTRDISDRGISVVVNHEFAYEDLLLGIWSSPKQSEEPWFFVGKRRYIGPMGAGFWTIGVELLEFANESYTRQIRLVVELAEKLLPATTMEPCNGT